MSDRIRSNRAGILILTLAAGSVLAFAQERPAPPPPPAQPVEARSPGEAPQPRPPRPPPIEDTRCYRLQVTIFEVTGAPQQLLTLEAESLTSAAKNAAALQTELAKVGTTSVRLRADQVVQTMGPIRFASGGDRAFVRAISNSPNGPTKVVDRDDVGAQFEFHPRPGKPGDPDNLCGDMSIRVQSIQFSSVSSAPEVPTPLSFKTEQNHATQLVSGRPVVLIQQNGANGPEEQAIAIVALMRADLIQTQ